MSNQPANFPGNRNQLKPIKVGVIGVGNMGQHHSRILSLLKDVEFVGVADVNVEKGLETASKYRVRFFENYLDLLPRVDAVCIAVPTRLHHRVGMDCLQGGVHTLIEKPIAASISEAEAGFAIAISAIVGINNTLSGFGLGTAAMRLLSRAYEENNSQEIQKIAGVCFSTSLAFGLLGFCLFTFGSPWIVQWSKYEGNPDLARLYCILLGLVFLLQQITGYFRFFKIFFLS